MKKLKDKCNHGKRVWGNYGDGKVRHMTNDGREQFDICDDYELKEN
jgi:hypothetical protein